MNFIFVTTKKHLNWRTIIKELKYVKCQNWIIKSILLKLYKYETSMRLQPYNNDIKINSWRSYESKKLY